MVKKIVMVMLLPTTIMANAYAGTVGDSLRTTVYYRPGYSLLDLSYMNNAASLERLKEGIRGMEGNPNIVLQRIKILSGASPEGATTLNKRLARRRGERLRDYLREKLILPDSIFVLSSLGEDWQGLVQELAKADVPWKDKALNIIENTPVWIVKNGKVVDGRKRRLQNLNGGKAWNYMLANHFETLRSGTVVVCEIRHIQPTDQSAVNPSDTLSSLASQQGSEVDSLSSLTHRQGSETDSLYHSNIGTSGSGQEGFFDGTTAETVLGNRYYALKTNLLYDALLVPNIGIETSIGRGWTLGASGMLAWWSKDASHKYWRIYGGEMEIRKYFGRKAKEKPMQGHHISLYGQFLTYDIENGGTGRQSKKTYGAGMEYGYSLPIGRRLNLDFGLGVGYIKSHYKTYEPKDGCYVYEATRNRTWIGPTRGEVSLVWLLGNGNTNSKKGGKK